MLDEFDNKEDITLYEKKAITDFFEGNGLKLERVDGRIAVVVDNDLRYLVVLDTYEGARGWLRGVHFALEGKIEEKDKKLRLTKSERQSAIDFLKGNTTRNPPQKSLADQLKYERRLLRNVLQMSSSEKTHCRDRLIRELDARDSGDGNGLE